MEYFTEITLALYMIFTYKKAGLSDDSTPSSCHYIDKFLSQGISGKQNAISEFGTCMDISYNMSKKPVFDIVKLDLQSKKNWV